MSIDISKNAGWRNYHGQSKKWEGLTCCNQYLKKKKKKIHTYLKR